MLLALDTATQLISLALYDGYNILAEQTWHTAFNHSTQLAPTLQSVLDRAGVSISDLTAMAVCIGPGSYSGLRVGVSLAKGLAAVHHLPLVGISALDIIAAAQPHYPDGLIVVVQAGRERVIVGRYQWRKAHWAPRGEVQLMDWEKLIDSVDGPAHVSGEISIAGHEILNEAKEKGTPLTIVPASFRLRRAGFLAQEAWERLKADETDFDAAKLVPFYVKTQDVPET
ncbi:MAG: tRNA (adenosine(37)-N6)-threonylcarbamoyltransferase complex dimerization subunit type 1 TsaB [Anaerolineaceae bacterium]|nr:tRNA (adenosine(37)-N6)-threonylcarbamoyltransferase complex dimerization subunit type 1 TsaB [Anaerolineaceae bacterium]